ncbi:MAG: type VI secretion system contractile sheath large subunit [Phycisphaerales bacterium]|nr:type VI secretion system contractile sheath large subunit [Phycisphaerales bacterium]
MASDPSQVHFSTGAEGQAATERRPYLAVFVGDLGAARLTGLTPVDKDDFAVVMKKAGIAPKLAIKDPLGGGGDDWEFQLTIDSIRSFDPVQFLTQIDGGRWRLGVRDKLMERQSGAITSAELDTALQAAAAADRSLAWLTAPMPSASASAAPAASPGGSVLDQVDEPTPQSRVEADVQKLAAGAGAVDARISAGESQWTAQRLARIDRELAMIANTVLKHPEIRRLETAWLSAKYLVDAADFRAGVRVSILSTSREESVDRFIEHVVNPAFNGDIPTPGIVVLDFAAANNPVDIERMDMLAQHAASLPVPVTFPIEADFFNVKSLRLIRNLPNYSGLFDTVQFAKWRTLREKPYAKSLAPVVGRFVLRPPHAKRDVKTFTFDETITAIGDIVWGGGHLALAVCAVRAYAKNGWPTRMFGAESGKISDLAVVDNPNDPQNPWGPGDLTLPDARLEELPTVGMNLLQAIPKKDYCMLLGGVSAAKPIVTAETPKQQAMLEVSLPYQQVTNITSAWICEQMGGLRGKGAADIQRELLYGLRTLFGLKDAEDEAAVGIGVGESPNAPGQTLVQVRLTPPSKIVPGGLHIDFGFTV